MKVGDTFYRIVDGYNDDSKPVLQTLRAVKLTPKGGWVVHSWAWPLREPANSARELWSIGAHLVVEGTRRAYAYPTIELALDSYRARKSWQIRHAERSIRRAKNALDWAGRAEIEDEFVTFAEPARPWAPNPLF